MTGDDKCPVTQLQLATLQSVLGRDEYGRLPEGLEQKDCRCWLTLPSGATEFAESLVEAGFLDRGFSEDPLRPGWFRYYANDSAIAVVERWSPAPPSPIPPDPETFCPCSPSECTGRYPRSQCRFNWYRDHGGDPVSFLARKSST